MIYNGKATKNGKKKDHGLLGRSPQKTLRCRIQLITEYCLRQTSAELCDPLNWLKSIFGAFPFSGLLARR